MYCKLSTLRDTLSPAEDIKNSRLVEHIETATAWVDSLYPRISPFGVVVPIDGEVDELVAGNAFALPDADPQATSGFDIVRASDGAEERTIPLLASPKFTHPMFDTVFFEHYSVHRYRQTEGGFGSLSTGRRYGITDNEPRHFQLNDEITDASASLVLFDNDLPVPLIRNGTQILLGPPPLIQRAALLYAQYLAWTERRNKGVQVDNDYVRRILFEAEETLQVKKPTVKADAFPQSGIATAKPHPLISLSRSSQRIVL